MGMEVKKLLYKYPQLKEARKNAKIAILSLETRERLYRADANWYIRGSLPSNPVEKEFIIEEDILGKIAYLKWVVGELDMIIDAVERAKDTLNEEQRELIQVRYFEGRSVVNVCDRISITDRQYHYLHRLVIENAEICLKPLSHVLTDDYVDKLIFGTYGTMMDRGKKVSLV